MAPVFPHLEEFFQELCSDHTSNYPPSYSLILEEDSKGKGAVRYVTTSDQRIVRVDTFLIPLEELSAEIGKKIGIAYYGSPTPPLLVNSVGFDKGGERYYGYHIPHEKYHDYTLKAGHEIDATEVPEGRNDISQSSLLSNLGTWA